MFGFGGNGFNGGKKQRVDKKGRPVRSIPLIDLNGNGVLSGIMKVGDRAFAIVVKPSNERKEDRKGRDIVAWADVKDLGQNQRNSGGNRW